MREYPLTHRQFLSWQAWLQDQWNQPSRTEWYLMGVMCEIRRVLAKHPNNIQPGQFQMAFTLKEGGKTRPAERLDGPMEGESEEEARERISRVAQATWLRRFGGKVVEVSPEEAARLKEERKQVEERSRERRRQKSLRQEPGRSESN